MSWINRAESRFGHLAIPGLPRIIVAFNALVYVLYKLNGDFISLLVLDPALVMKGQVWRLVTYIFIPSFGGFPLPDWLGVILYLLFINFIGNGVEEAMGPFKTTWYYLVGMLGITVAGFVFGTGLSAFVLNTSLLFVFARFFPEVVIYIMFVLPVKVKWMAWVYAALLLYGFMIGSWSVRAALIAGFSNYLLFFGSGIVADAKQRSDVSSRRRKFERDARIPEDEPLHRCAICGRTDVNSPQLEFRVSKDGNEYCLEHLPKPGAPVSTPPPLSSGPQNPA
jgi:hypothetical protein